MQPHTTTESGSWLMNGRKRKPKSITPYPEKIETAAERGQALRHWIDTHNTTVDAVEIETGLSRVTLYKYFKGELDIALMHQQNVTRLLTAMNMSDWDAYSYFNIPFENRGTNWRTVRPHPMGHGDEIAFELLTIELDIPMHGVFSFQPVPGVKFNLVLEKHGQGSILVYLAGSVFFTVVKGSPVQPDWKLLGSFQSLSVVELTLRQQGTQKS